MREEYNPAESTPGDLPGIWRERAEFLQDFRDPTSARLWLLAAVELDRSLQALGEETLSLVQGARESGYTSDHLGSLVRRAVVRIVPYPACELPEDCPGTLILLAGHLQYQGRYLG